jgi:hypothetical protein
MAAERRCGRRGAETVVLLAGCLLAGLLAAGPARAEDAALVAASERMDRALDAGRAGDMLDALAEAVRLAPAQGPDLAAAAALVAPWMAAEVAATALGALPAARRAGAAGPVLAAVLVATEGRQGGTVLAAVRRAAPTADLALLEDLTDRLAVAGPEVTVPGDATVALFDLAAPSAAMRQALKDARAAVAAGRLAVDRATATWPRGAGPEAVAPLAVPRLDTEGRDGDLLRVEPALDLAPILAPPIDRPSPS